MMVGEVINKLYPGMSELLYVVANEDRQERGRSLPIWGKESNTRPPFTYQGDFGWVTPILLPVCWRNIDYRPTVPGAPLRGSSLL